MKTKRFRQLPPKQSEVFEQVASGNSRGHHPATLLALCGKGLIEFHDAVLGKDHFGNIIVKVPYVPVPIHMEWCQWCSDE